MLQDVESISKASINIINLHVQTPQAVSITYLSNDCWMTEIAWGYNKQITHRIDV